MQTVFPQALFVCLHRPCDGACAGYRVHAQLVKLIVPFTYELQVVIHYAAAEKSERFKLRPLDLVIADLDGARALHRAGKAALVDDVYILGQRFAVYKLEVLKLPLGVVAR